MPHKLLPPGRRGPYWYLRGSDQEGRFEYSTGESTRRGAEAWAQEFFVRRAGRRVPGAGEPVAFATAAQHYRAFKRLSRAEERLVDAVARYFGSTDCRAIVHAQLVAAATALRPQGKDSTRNRKVIAPAAAVLHHAADQKWCSYQRLPKFKESRKSNREPATEDTLRLLMANVEKPRENKRGRKCDVNVAHKRLLLAMLYELGLRITDLLRIDWRAINLSTGRVVVKIAKTDETASLELSHVVVAMLANLPRKDGRLFPWSNRSGV